MTIEEKLAEDLVAADKYLQLGDFNQAYEIYQQLLQKFPTPEIYNNAAICAYNLELISESLSLISEALAKDPDNPWYLTQHAQFVATSDFNLADQLFNKALGLANRNVNALKNEQLKQREHQPNQDEQQLAVHQQIKHCYATFLFNYGCVHGNQPEKSQINQAINLFKKSLELDAHLYKSAYNLACCYINLDDFEQGLNYLLKTIELNPAHSQAHFALSQYYQQQDNIALAEQHLLKSLASKSINQANAEYNYGVLEQKRNNYEKALAHYSNCLALDPAHFAACYNSASIYHRLENHQDAIKYYQMALKIKPEDDACQYLLASLSPLYQSDNLVVEQTSPTRAPSNYIENLFDSYAESFDHELVVNLEYKTPELLFNLLADFNLQPEYNLQHEHNLQPGYHVQKSLSNLDILDLGCGTGLSGEIFKPLAKNLTGVDLSSKMLDCARVKNIYDRLIKADLDTFLLKNIEENNPYDLIILADVLVYYGDLQPLFQKIVNNLKPGGWLLFSTELGDNSSPQYLSDYKLQTSSRFAHNIDYVKSALNDARLNLMNSKIVCLRQQNHQNLMGSLFLATI